MAKNHHEKRASLSFVLVGIASICILAATVGCGGTGQGNGDDGKPPRVAISWMRSWATTGQIMETLSHTNIPQLYGSHATFPNFLFGPEMNEAALNGSVDGTNTGIVPTISLLAASDDWVVICRLIDFEVATVARNGSGIESISDLKGKRIAVPFGGGSHPYVLQRFEEHGLEVGEGQDEVHLINLKPSEQPIAMENGSVDAVGTWEPQTTIIVGRGYGNVIDTFRHVGYVTVRKDIAEQYPGEIVSLLKAYVEANYFVAKHRGQTDRWFAETSGYELELTQNIRVIEPNLNATSMKEIDICITKADIKLTNQVADVMAQADLIPRRIDFAKFVDGSYLEKALESLRKDGVKADEVRVVD